MKYLLALVLIMSTCACAVENTFRGRLFGEPYEKREKGDVALTTAISLLKAGVPDASVVEVIIGQGYTDAEARRILAQAQAQLSAK